MRVRESIGHYGPAICETKVRSAPVKSSGDDAEALHQLKLLRFRIGSSMPMRTRPTPRRRIKPFPIRLEPSKRARLEELAEADRRTLSNYILKVLYDHIDAIEMSRDKPRK